MIKRFSANPIIEPKDCVPFAPDGEVLCAFNPGATLVEGKTVLLLRVAERPIPEKGWVKTYVLDRDNPGRLKTMALKEDDPDLDCFDKRVFRYKNDLFLTSISHLRKAVSSDGRCFDIDTQPFIVPEFSYESYGVEDPRITQIGDTFYVNYSAISPWGVATCLARTQDWKEVEKLGIIFAPDNKDIAVFPEKIKGRYYCFHRPSMKQLGQPSVWLASSDNLLDWGRHRFLFGPRKGFWDSERVGCGALPIKTEKGWLELYHASDENTCYASGAALLDLENPEKLIARSDRPVLFPEEPYEKEGFLPNIIFQSGLVQRNEEKIDLYYGAGDLCACGAELNLPALMDTLV